MNILTMQYTPLYRESFAAKLCTVSRCVQVYTFVMHVYRGRIHDYEIFKNKHPTTPLQAENILDLGYLGVKDDFPTVKYVLPFRKKRKCELSDEEKKYNRRHSKLRIIVEHSVSRIKKFGMVQNHLF